MSALIADACTQYTDACGTSNTQVIPLSQIPDIPPIHTLASTGFNAVDWVLIFLLLALAAAITLLVDRWLIPELRRLRAIYLTPHIRRTTNR